MYPDRFEAHYPTMDRFWLSLFHHHDLSPKPDDALVTLGRSLARIAAKHFTEKFNCSGPISKKQEEKFANSKENDGDVQLLEMTAYNHEDEFQGILIRFTTPITKQRSIDGGANFSQEVYTVSAEAWFGLKSHVEVAPWSKNIAKYRSKLQVR